MHTKDNYGGLDRFRLIAALLVIAIHTSPLDSFSPEGDFFLTRVLARIAVPFFFMVTGQFVAGALISADGEQSGHQLLLRYLRKISILYTVSIILYLPVGIYAGHYQNVTLPLILRMILLDGTFYHLWYFPACLLGMVLVYLMSRFLKLRGIIAVSAVLYLVGLLGDSYFGLVQKLPPLKAIYEAFFQICSYTRNGLFFAPLFLALGAWCSRNNRRGTAVHLTILVFSFLLMTAEAFTLRHFSWQRHDSMYFMLVPVMISLYRLLLCFPGSGGKVEKRFRSVSLWVYILHPSFIIIVRGGAKVFHLTPLLVDNSLVHYFAVSVLSVCTGFGIAFLAEHVHFLCHKIHRSWEKTDKVRTTSSAGGLDMFQPITPLQAAGHATLAAFANILRTLAHCSRESGKLPLPESSQERIQLEAARGSKLIKFDRLGKSPLPHPSLRGRAWIELDKTALARNVEYLRSLMLEGCRLMPAVKANAYGHGAVWTATELNRLGVDAFCVACVSEGITLRNAKVKGEILILGYTAPEDFTLLARYRLTQTVIDYEYAEKLAEVGVVIHVHIGIDTGMHRLGIRCEDIEDILAVFEMKNLVIDGMFTHLCACDSLLPEDRAFTESQIQAFYSVVEILEERGLPCPKLHLQSSYGLLNYSGLDADYVRAGIALYGVPSSVMDAGSAGNRALNDIVCPANDMTWNEITNSTENIDFDRTSDFSKNLAPVLSLKARVASIRTLYAGESAGYGLAFTAEKDMRIAVLSIGYADGLPRELSCGKGYVLLHGLKAPVIGRICMDQTLVDISGIPQVSARDIAVLIGVSGNEEITAVQLASQCGTITNELLSRLGERLERVESIAEFSI